MKQERVLKDIQRASEGIIKSLEDLEGFDAGPPVSKGPHVDFECRVIALADDCFMSLRQMFVCMNSKSWRWLIPRFFKTHGRFPVDIWKAARSIGKKSVPSAFLWVLITLLLYPQYVILEALLRKRFEIIQAWIYPWNYWITVKILLDSKRKH